MPRGRKQVKESPKEVKITEKKIKKTKKIQQKDENDEPSSAPQSPVKKGKKQIKQAVKATKPKFNKLFYPETPNQQFPNLLNETLYKIIASFNNSASLQEIQNNLGLFYENAVIENYLYQTLATAEEQGTIYERNGLYSVADDLLPAAPEPIPEPEPIVVEKVDSALKQVSVEQVNFEEEAPIQPFSEKKESKSDCDLDDIIDPTQENEGLFE